MFELRLSYSNINQPNWTVKNLMDQMESALEICEPVPQAELRADIERLGDEGPIARQGPLDVYLTCAESIPAVMREIGRLRETTFRGIGVGTGKVCDLDHYDDYYDQLFLWDRENHAVVGAYRIARTDQVFADHGFSGLYTASLCECDQPLIDYLNPALELGRSWIAKDYQRSLHPLLGLWKGIGHFVAREPKYYKLFGAVSIGRNYSSVSQDIIVRFFRREKTDTLWKNAMRALLPFKNLPDDLSAELATIDDVSARVATHEPDGKGIPVLLRQYFKLNATLLEFVHDPNFTQCLDAMVLVDLRRAPDFLLKKYMGKKGQARFREGLA